MLTLTERGDSYIAGTVIGGQNAAATNKSRYGEDFYSRIGAIGGKKGTTGGFAANRELARIAGAKGGSISSRRGVKNKPKAEPSLITRIKQAFNG